MNEGIAAVIAALVAAFVAYLVSNRDLSDSLDSKSEWRKKIFEVASTYELTLDHAQTVRATLRFLPQDKAVEEYSFAWFSNVMTKHLDDYILSGKYQVEEKKSWENTKKIKELNTQCIEIEELKENKLRAFDTKIVRLFAMFLLKYHYENISSMGPKEYLFIGKRNKNKTYNPIVAEVYYKYIELIKEEFKMAQNGKDFQGNKNGYSATLWIKPVLLLFSLLFILIIVIGLFEKIAGNELLKIKLLNIPLFNIKIFVIKFIGTESKHFLYAFSLVIALLSSCIVYQKDKEKEQKQQDMTGKIEELDSVLKQIYGEGK